MDEFFKVGSYVKSTVKDCHYGVITRRMTMMSWEVEYVIPFKYTEIVAWDEIEPFEKGSESSFKNQLLEEDKKKREELKQIYIDMALQTNDKEWFMELTKEN